MNEAEIRADERRKALADAKAAVERQTVLASMVAARPTDFEKAIITCSAAIDHMIRELD